MKPMMCWSLEIKTWCFNNGMAFSAEKKDWIVHLENCNMSYKSN